MISRKSGILCCLTIVLTLITNLQTKAQLSVNGAMTPAQLVQNVLLGTGITATNITYTGNIAARGSFNGASSNIGFSSGVILSTGDINNAEGPNNNSGTSTGFGTVSFDPQLSAIATSTINDAAILSFDFIPVADTLKFRYVFGSEEYMEWAGTSFNDVFGFFITGPNPAGGNYTNQNIARIPGTTTPVSINNVNLSVNSQYYFDNGDGTASGTAPDGATVQYDGFTHPLMAKAAVICGQTYHIKIAIADVSDDALDSGVFLEAGSFTSQGVSIIPQISYGGANDSTLYEGCGQACIYFIRTSNLSNADSVNVTIGGSAINGVDYNTGVPGVLLPTQLIFQPGQDSVSYCINAVTDALAEGLESITLSILQTGICVTSVTSATIYINEYLPITLITSGDTTFCGTGMGGSVTLNAIVSGGVEPYSYSWSNGAAPISNPTVITNIPTTYVVTVNDACNGTPDPTPVVTDSVVVNVLNYPAVSVGIYQVLSYGGPNDSVLYEGCGQACIHFVRTSSLAVIDTLTITIGGLAQNGLDYYYGVPGDSLPNQLVFQPGQDTVTYCINASPDGNMEGLESINLSIFQSNPCVQSNISSDLYLYEYLPLTLSTTGDTTFCNLGAGGTVTLNALVLGGVEPYFYSWTNGAAPTANPTVVVNNSTVYYVTVNDACSSIPISDSVIVDVLNFPNVTVGIYPSISYGGVNDSVLYEGCGQACIHFIRTSSLTVADTLSIVINGTAQNSLDYYYGVPGDSLPSQLIFPVGQNTVTYCIDAVSDGTNEGLENINLSIFQSNPCVQTSTTATVFINEHLPITLSTSGDSTFCNQGLGGNVTLHADVSGGVEPYSYAWTNTANTTSDPIVTVNTTTTYIVTVNDACLGSPDPTPAVIDSVNVTVLNFPAVAVNMVPTISYNSVTDTILYEGCGQACINFIRTSSLLWADTLTLTISGSAQNAIDYYYGTQGTSLPTQLIFPVGQNTITWCINAITDGVIEGIENVNLSIVQSNPCIQSTTSVIIPISEHELLSLITSGDTILCNQGGTVTIHATANGGLEPYTYQWTNGAASVADPAVNVNSTTTFVVTVNDACSGSPDATPAIIDSATVSVQMFDPLTINAGKDIEVCPGEIIYLSALANGGGAPYIYQWSNYSATDSLSSYIVASTTLTANTTGVYQISVLDICQNTQYDQVTINVDQNCTLYIPNVMTPDGQGSQENESFYIKNLDKYPGSEVTIYNRWGNKIYSNSNYQNNWNGGGHGDGTYYYVLKVSDGRSLITGFFQLSRVK